MPATKFALVQHLFGALLPQSSLHECTNLWYLYNSLRSSRHSVKALHLVYYILEAAGYTEHLEELCHFIEVSESVQLPQLAFRKLQIDIAEGLDRKNAEDLISILSTELCAHRDHYKKSNYVETILHLFVRAEEKELIAPDKTMMLSDWMWEIGNVAMQSTIRKFKPNDQLILGPKPNAACDQLKQTTCVTGTPPQGGKSKYAYVSNTNLEFEDRMKQY